MTSPIIETNIERIIEEHTPGEVLGIEKRIADLLDELKTLRSRKNKLLNIMEAAELAHDFETEAE